MKIFLFFSMLFLAFHHPIFADREVDQSKNREKQSNFVVVCCSGKSGSSTLEKSFQQLNIETYRIHVFTNEIYHDILTRMKDTKILLIDSTRDVISRRISSYFQNLTFHLNLSIDQILEKYRKQGSSFISFLIKDFNQKIIPLEQYYSFSDWKTLDYNCLKDENFNFEKKYQLKKIDNLYFVNLRFDDIKNWEEIIRSLDIPFDLKNFKILPRNIGKNKWYSDLYTDFLLHFTLNEAAFNTIVRNNQEEILHFYTTEEIEKFFNKWKPYLRN